MDYFIRQEKLTEGIAYVNRVLEIEKYSRKIPKFKSGIRSQQISIRDFYDQETQERVEKLYSWELENFQYELLEC